MGATFIYPTVKRVTSKFRTPSRPNHHGVDFAEPGYQEVKAAADGHVVKSYLSSSYGHCIIVEHVINGDVWQTLYAHLKERKVFLGDKVKQGQVIGIMGNTGDSTGQHLHFELHKGRWNINKTDAVDPLKYLGKDLYPKSDSKTDTFKVVTTLDGYVTAADAKKRVSKVTTVKPGTYYVFNESQGMINVTSKKGVPGSWINPTENKQSSQSKPKYNMDSIVPYPGNLIKRGSKGIDVERVQRAVNVIPDGIFGPKTEAAVKAYQKRHGLKVDGIVGPKTWAVMF